MPTQADTRFQEALDALGIEEQDALDLFYAVNAEIQNPSTPVDGVYDEYTFEQALKTIRPDANEDQFEALTAAYVAGGYSNHLRVELPQQGRYQTAIADNLREQEQFYEGLPNNLVEVFRTSFGAGRLDVHLPDFNYELINNLEALNNGETISRAPINYEAPSPEELLSGELPPGAEYLPPEIQFDDHEAYLAFELEQIKLLYPDLADINDPSVLEQYAALKGRELYLDLTEPGTFELLDDSVRKARFHRTLSDIGAPGDSGGRCL